MKRTLILVLAFLMLFNFTACNPKIEQKVETEITTPQKMTKERLILFTLCSEAVNEYNNLRPEEQRIPYTATNKTVLNSFEAVNDIGSKDCIGWNTIVTFTTPDKVRHTYSMDMEILKAAPPIQKSVKVKIDGVPIDTSFLQIVVNAAVTMEEYEKSTGEAKKLPFTYADGIVLKRFDRIDSDTMSGTINYFGKDYDVVVSNLGLAVSTVDGKRVYD